MVIEVAIPRDQIQATTVLRKEDMIGQMAKRTLMANIPVNQKDIMPPTLVKRNELITVVYRNGMVNLTTRARATENASKGQVITLINLTSKKPFQAVVSGLQQAEIIIEQNS
jgi:flagella basal body P-ring formation protein FlgA